MGGQRGAGWCMGSGCCRQMWPAVGCDGFRGESGQRGREHATDRRRRDQGMGITPEDGLHSSEPACRALVFPSAGRPWSVGKAGKTGSRNPRGGNACLREKLVPHRCRADATHRFRPNSLRVAHRSENRLMGGARGRRRGPTLARRRRRPRRSHQPKCPVASMRMPRVARNVGNAVEFVPDTCVDAWVDDNVQMGPLLLKHSKHVAAGRHTCCPAHGPLDRRAGNSQMRSRGDGLELSRRKSCGGAEEPRATWLESVGAPRISISRYTSGVACSRLQERGTAQGCDAKGKRLSVPTWYHIWKVDYCGDPRFSGKWAAS